MPHTRLLPSVSRLARRACAAARAAMTRTSAIGSGNVQSMTGSFHCGSPDALKADGSPHGGAFETTERQGGAQIRLRWPLLPCTARMSPRTRSVDFVHVGH